MDLPVFPWTKLAPYRDLAAQFMGPVVDLSVGTPVDDTPKSLQDTLRNSTNMPGYPSVTGSGELRRAIAEWFARRRRATGLDEGCIIPTVGSKELVANLGWQLGLGVDATILIPEVAYPTYDICGRVCGARVIPVSEDPAHWPRADLVWINTPGNPHGHVYSARQLRDIVRWARQCGAVVVSDECYAELPWVEPYISEGVPCLLDRQVCEGDFSGLLVAYSLSKQSNLAGYRAAFLAGDPQLIARVALVRRHCGFIVPGPVQEVLRVAVADDNHVIGQRRIYGRRREILIPALTRAGLVLDADTAAGLYLWAEFDGVDCWQLVEAFARLGIVVAPGSFYGAKSGSQVRIGLTAGDWEIQLAAQRLEDLGLAF